MEEEKQLTHEPETAVFNEANGTDSVQEDKGKKILDRIKKIKLGKKAKKRIIIGVIILALFTGLFVVPQITARKKMAEIAQQPVFVERRDISQTIQGEAVLLPNDSYAITSITTGEIVSDAFDEGDLVQKDDILYVFDNETAANNVKTAQNNYKKAQQNYEDAVKTAGLSTDSNAKSEQSARLSVKKAQQSYDDALKLKKDLTVTASKSGNVTEVYVSTGDNVAAGGKIADIYEDKYMKIRIPFNVPDAENISPGDSGAVTVTGTGNEIYATVTAVDDYTSANSAHMQVKYVTMELENPGALTTDDKGTAVINGFACNDAGSFEYIESHTITAKASGKVDKLYIDEGNKVYSGQTVAVLSSDSVDTQLKNAEISLKDANLALEKTLISASDPSKESNVLSAKLSLDDAKIKLEDAQKGLDDYSIKAPISGTVVVKNVKAGDKVDAKNSATSLAEIYDLSKLKFQLSVDEMDIKDVMVGSKVKVTADASEGQEYEGIVDTVGINGTSENGVTTYPVTVLIKDYGELLPGMNIDAEIVSATVKNVLSIPVSGVRRGNIVYVKGEKLDQNDRAPEGYKTVTVEVGLNDDEYIEIKSGLHEGEEIQCEQVEQRTLQEMMMDASMGEGAHGGAPDGAPGGGHP